MSHRVNSLEPCSYLFNPYTFLSTASLSTSTIDNTLYVATLYFACTSAWIASLETPQLISVC